MINVYCLGQFTATVSNKLDFMNSLQEYQQDVDAVNWAVESAWRYPD